ncbi:protein 3-oxoalanine-generating enzyme family protein [Gemmobacter nanjingensis]|uniref:Protein 3-oxoalanine-generating enzyme family protein n=2 Tax=Gemmobacter nanjingensis TaxID=488454 RepID=A0ABQ3F7Y2_9RHOB|nr:protein 3-oxoalanine-generating enzyme family protein [Gemmobacter nanjingensis]
MQVMPPACRRRLIVTALSLVVLIPSGALAEASGASLTPLSIFRECDACPEMIVMPPGSFIMGAIPGESRDPFYYDKAKDQFGRRKPGEVNILPAEHPRHRVEMDVPFAMARNETTHAEWMECVDDGGCSRVPDHRVVTINGYIRLGPRHPVINISWQDAQTYVDWLNRKVGQPVYRLPTEAEWEYAARAGTETPFAQGDALTSDQANFSRLGTENILGHPMPELRDPNGPVTVDELDAANRWGLRHMSGNVFEYTLSCWTPEHLGLSSDSAYLAQARATTTCRRVEKGGSYQTSMDSLRPAHRRFGSEDFAMPSYGFRVIRELRVEAGGG